MRIMTNILNNTYVLTDVGIIPSSDITKKNYVLTAKSELSKVKANNIYAVIPELSYVFKNSIDDIEFLLRCDEKIHLSTTEGNVVIPAGNVEVGSWLYHPWITREYDSYLYTLDLSKYTDNHFDHDSIYLFNHKILQIADELDIEPYVLKEILCREAAEYDEYIPKIKEFIETSFCPFDEFQKYAADNFVYKMPRYIPVDANYAALLTSFIKYSSSKSKVLSKTNCKATSYKVIFQYPTGKKYDVLIKNTKSFLEKNNIKFLEETHVASRKLILYNKPLFELNSRVYANTLGTFIKASPETSELFKQYMHIDTKPIYGSIRLLLSLKEFFFYNKVVGGIRLDELNTPYFQLLKDDFEQIDSTLIIGSEGYFSRIVAKDPYEESENIPNKLSLLLTDAENYVTISYTKEL